jgi:hypothetical protein
VEKYNVLPNLFYDFIVFVGSTVVFAVGLYIGVGGLNHAWLRTFDFRTIDVVLVAGMVVLASYEYGRIAEAWSFWLVQKPLAFIAKKTDLLSDPDFLAQLPLNDPRFSSLLIPEAKRGNKWTVYFYASLVEPGLGGDLLKRYAWEKLARNSAFSYAVLLIISAYITIIDLWTHAEPLGKWAFGTRQFNLTVGILVVLTYFEYYKRNSWNNDLLVKVIPILFKAEELAREKKYIQIISAGDGDLPLREISHLAGAGTPSSVGEQNRIETTVPTPHKKKR